jgi:eukaryotic-like serine/threonine-protein kinase
MALRTQRLENFGSYELVQHLATGGMAEVYLARRAGPHGFEKTFALKRIIPQFVTDADFVAMFVDEARVSAQLSHPNIVQVFDFGDHNGQLYMAMEYVQGTSVAKLLRALLGRPSVLSLEGVFHIVLSVLRALDYAHNARGAEGPLRLVHRDVSPGNILIHESGAVKLADFGIARATQIERRTDAGQIRGKLGYMSPEQVVGRELDARSDLFTLGAVFAELLVGESLFGGISELEVLMRIRDVDLRVLDRAAPQVPDDIRAVVCRALAKKPEERFASAAAFASALEDVAGRRRMQIAPGSLVSALERVGLAIPQRTPSKPAPFSVPAATVSPHSSHSSPSQLLEAARISIPSAPLPAFWSVRVGADIQSAMTFPEVVECFVTGRVPASGEVARDRGAFRAASTYPELSRFVTSPGLAWSEQMPTGVVDRRLIERSQLPSRLFFLAVTRETGALMLHAGGRRKKIFFVDGIPLFVVSTDRDELLGECLVRKGQVLRMELDMALAMLPEFDGRLGDALVGLGILRPIELFRAVLDQTEERIVESMKWSDGEIAFLPGARCHEETLPLGVRPFELIARGIRAHYTQDEISDILSRLGDDPIERISPLPVRIESFRLPEREERVLRALDVKISRQELEDRMMLSGDISAEDVSRALFFGLSCDVLRASKWRGFTSMHPRR